MKKVLLALSFVALSSVWASTAQDDDLVDFELAALTTDGEAWVPAPGVKVFFASSRSVTKWKKSKSLGEDRSTSTALRELGSLAETTDQGVARLRVGDERVTVLCELHGLSTTRSLSTRVIKSGKTEIKLQNGFMEQAWTKRYEEHFPSDTYGVLRLLDGDGEPIRYQQSEAFFAAKILQWEEVEEPWVGIEEDLGRWVLVNGLPPTNRAGETFFPLDARWESSSGHVLHLEESLTRLENLEFLEIHIKVVNGAEAGSKEGPVVTTRLIAEGPFDAEALDFGEAFLAEPPIIAAGYVVDGEGVPIPGASIVPIGCSKGDKEFGELEHSSFSSHRDVNFPFWFHLHGSSMIPTHSGWRSEPEFAGPRTTSDEGRFVVRGRFLDDSIFSEEDANRRTSSDLLVERPPLFDGELEFFVSHDDYLSKTVTIPIGTAEFRVMLEKKPKLTGSVLLPEGFPSNAITVIARDRDGVAFGDPMSISPSGELVMSHFDGPRVVSWDDDEPSKIPERYEISPIPSKVPAGRYNLSFELLAEHDPDQANSFYQVPGVVLRVGEESADVRLQGLDLREHLFIHQIDVSDPNGDPVDLAICTFTPEGGGPISMSVVRGGSGQLLTSSSSVDLRVFCGGLFSARADGVSGERSIQMSPGISAFVKALPGLDAPQIFGDRDEGRFLLTLEISHRFDNREVFGEYSPFSSSEYAAIDADGECILVANGAAAWIAGLTWKVEVVDPTKETPIVFSTEGLTEGSYELSWSARYWAPDLSGSTEGMGGDAYVEVSLKDLEEWRHYRVPLTQKDIDEYLDPVKERLREKY